MHKIIEFIINLIIKKPILCLGASAFLFLICIPGAQFIKRDHSPEIWFRTDDPLITQLREFEAKFGNDESIIIALNDEKGIFNKKTLETLFLLTKELWLIPGVLRVDSLTNNSHSHSKNDELIIQPYFPDSLNEFQALGQEEIITIEKMAMNDDVVLDYLVDKSGKTALLFARLKPYFKPEKADYRLITESTRELVKKYRNDSDLRFFISGPAIVNDSFREVSDKDMTTMLPITILIIFFILFLSFKNLYSVLLTLSVVATSIPATMALAGYLNITFNELVFTVPGIMLAICIADCVHILNSFYQKKRQGFENKDSLIFSLRKNILPTFMTSLTTFIGFISLTNTGLVPVQSLGLLAAIGTVYAWIFTLFFMSPLILFLPEWGHRLLFTQKKEILIFSSEKWFSFIKNYQYSIITFFVILFGFGLFFGLKNEVNSNPYKYFRDKVPVKIANDFFVDTLGGNQGPQLVIETTPDGITEPEFLRKVEKLHLWMEELDYVDNVISLIDVIKQLNKSLHNDDPRFYTIPDTKEAVAQLLLLYSMSLPQGKGIEDLVTFQYDTLKLTLMWSQQNTKEAAEALQVIETKIKEFGLNGYTSGKIPLFINMNTYIVSTFFNSMASAFILVTIFLIFLFRSVYLGLLSLLPNIIPLAIGSAIMYFWGKPIDVGTALVASICLGIAVDDTIHFLLNYFQFLKEETSENALKKTFEVTGKALIYTTVILVCGFGAFVMGDFIPNVNFGVMSAIVLTIALLTDLIFLPALILRKAIN